MIDFTTLLEAIAAVVLLILELQKRWKLSHPLFLVELSNGSLVKKNG